VNMAANYTFAEMADILLCYGSAHGNAHEAHHLYEELFPGCIIPDALMFTTIHLGGKGTFVPVTHDRARPRAVCTPDPEDRILIHVANNPATSTEDHCTGRCPPVNCLTSPSRAVPVFISPAVNTKPTP
jgi:hypothetical protein